MPYILPGVFKTICQRISETYGEDLNVSFSSRAKNCYCSVKQLFRINIKSTAAFSDALHHDSELRSAHHAHVINDSRAIPLLSTSKRFS